MSTVRDAANASKNGRTDRILNQRNRSGIESIPGPPPPIKACTTIQFSKTGPFGAKGNSTARSKPKSIGLLRISGEVSTGSAAKRRRTRIIAGAHLEVKSSEEQIFAELPRAIARFPRVCRHTTIRRDIDAFCSGPNPLQIVASQLGGRGIRGKIGAGKLRCDDYSAWLPSVSVFITSGTTLTQPSSSHRSARSDSRFCSSSPLPINSSLISAGAAERVVDNCHA